MADTAFHTRTARLWTSWIPELRRVDRVTAAFAAALLGLIALAPAQGLASAAFVGSSLASIAPWFAISVLVAAAAKATGADALIAHAFVGRESRMIVVAAAFGALSPFCSCGVIPVIAGLLGSGVPLAPVMAFWIASPLMDPNQFVLLAGTLGLEFALAKTAAALAMGLAAGFATLALTRAGLADDALRKAPSSACAMRAARKVLTRPTPVWRFWTEAERAQAFVVETGRTGWFLLRWLAVAFLVESLMVAYLPGEAIARLLGGDGPFAIPLAVAIGVPAYLNGFAAIPPMEGLVALGMSKAVALAFMVAGGVTSIPAALAVWALVKPRVFAIYLVLAAAGALAVGYGYAAWLAAAA
jgi:uncharacterized membrane protein YraQ (UPF0718 family)